MDLKDFIKDNKNLCFKVPTKICLMNASSCEFKVYLFFAQKHTFWNPTQRELGELLGLTKRTIIRAIASLVSKGYLIKEDGFGERNQNIYRATWPH